MDPGVKLTVDGVPFSDPQRCKRKVEKLNYLCITMPDISFPISFVSQFMRFLTNTQWEAFIHIKQLKKALGKGIAYQDHGHIQEETFSDADHIWSRMDRKSTI